MKMNALLLGLPLALAACSPNTGTSDPTSVVAPTQQMVESAPSMNESITEKKAGSIVDVATQNGNFKTLLAAAQAAGLANTLATGGPFTVFAPTDAAFAKLPAGTVEGLLKNPEELAKILKYHVVSGKVDAEAVSKLTTATTLLGQNVSIDTSNGVKINKATITQADVMADNGIIHVIDTVLLPE